MPIDFDVMFWQMRFAGTRQRGWRGGESTRRVWQARPRCRRDRSLEDVLEEHLGALGVPAIYGLPLGHGPHLASVPFGVTATLDADARTLTINEPGVRD